ncbi:hypothetical protein PHMEG_0005111 [Phytophthora megakarya]|uniref:Uncharacterized protein n=1 Tax=Phytophthora megakarya TaxID=4795 RepID=A0A225WS39_9STRA|nr:hypothetical protein PHMEG_0005111 [Phytophthora megakarya]
MGDGCTCGLLPCICVGDAEDAVDFVDGTHDLQNPEGAMTAKAKLRQLFAANATAQCINCMMLPCICPAEDDDEMRGDDETTSVEAVSPVVSDQDAAVDEETDAYGRVRLSSNDVWVAREIKPLLKPHQVKGVQFLHSHVAAGRGCILADYMGLGKTLQVITVIYSFLIDELDARKRRSKDADSPDDKSDVTSEGQTTRDDVEPPATVLVLCPAICLPNWDSEFQKWLGAEARERCPVLTLDSSSTKGTTAGRLRLLQRWKRTGGVLLMGYEMFRGLLNPTMASASCSSERETSIRVCSRMASATMEVTSVSAQETAKMQRTVREFRSLLCSPGADLVVMDEGHRMKDPSSLLCQSVAQIKSHRRLVLTGYPVQNSLSEYWCMVNFARESFLGTYDEFRAKYERPILEGNVTRSQELIEKLQSIVLRRGKALLRSQLPPKKEWILYCKLSPVQHRLYCHFLGSFCDGGSLGRATADLLTAYAALLQVMNHPDIIYSKLCPSQDDGSALLLDGDDEFNDSLPTLDDSSGWAWESEERLQEKRQIAAAQRRRKRQKLTNTQKSYEWARSVIFGGEVSGASADTVTGVYHTEMLENSGKMAVLLRIVQESFTCGDKVVVFSQSVPTLKVISDFLRASEFSPSRAADDATKARKSVKGGGVAHKPKRRKIASRPNRDPAGILRKRRNVAKASGTGTRQTPASLFTVSNAPSDEWFLQIDGSTNGSKRMEYIQRFSSADSPVKLLLVSTRAGAEGINLHAANRLVLFDVSWNPSNDHQSMCRSHRIGQAKTVHVYRLVSTGTMERMIYEQQIKKVDLSTSVVDSHERIDQNERAADSSSADSTGTNSLAKTSLVPFSGFLQAPTEPNYDQELEVDESTIKDDSVLAACVKLLGHWLVDVHREERNVTDAKKKTKLRVRYYVELVVGSPRESHTRLGFSGSFQGLMRLHREFVRLYIEKHGDPHGGLLTGRESFLSTSSSTSRSSVSSSKGSPTSLTSRVRHTFGLKKKKSAGDGGQDTTKQHAHHTHHHHSHQPYQTSLDTPGIVPFPAQNKILVHLESGEAKDDDKIEARNTALFGYYSQLFNSDDGEMYLELVHQHAKERANKNKSEVLENQSEDAAEPPSSGGIFKLLGRQPKTDDAKINKHIEFFEPVYVRARGKSRGHKSTRRNSSLQAP